MIIGFDNRRKCPVVVPQDPTEKYLIARVTTVFDQTKMTVEMLLVLVDWVMVAKKDRNALEEHIEVFITNKNSAQE